ncbi:hypothetical protein L5515_016652 [Caenorhabditis briggsae]|uniref:Uncharacterized protein n=1 Tax=Caenorhabditis briggsae TaxID=6238 RepID=A0AAE9FHK5_CAEBR|nr:hypothetical protein L5515_016652 [Caenorhabditis briggsae]
MFLKPALLVTAILATALALEEHYDREGNKMHYCPSCATKGYVLKRWLMQHSESGQSMGWFDWRGSNCEEGVVFVVPCSNACLTVTVEKQKGGTEYEYVGSMQECSDQMIHGSPDLPGGTDYKAYNKSKVFVAKRMGHRITYNFTRQSYIDIHSSMTYDIKDHEVVVLTERKIRKLSAWTYRDWLMVASLVIMGCLISCCCRALFCQVKASKPSVIRRADGVEDIRCEVLTEQNPTAPEEEKEVEQVMEKKKEDGEMDIAEEPVAKEDSPV